MPIAPRPEPAAAPTRPAARRLRARGDDGAAAVEFALVVPLLLVLVFGIIDFGILFGQNLSLNNAARDAGRFGVVRQIDGSAGRTCYAVLKRTRDASVAIALTPTDVGVTVTRSGTTICSIAAGTALPATANTAALQKLPCAGSVGGTDDQLRVAATYSGRLVIPILPGSSFALTGNGYFKCEYS
jgi:Flp pilus assembly protein TadG